MVALEGQCRIFWDPTRTSPLTVTGLFDAIESSILTPTFLTPQTGYVKVDVVYDDRLGYPVRVNHYLARDWGQPMATVLVYLPETEITLTVLE